MLNNISEYNEEYIQLIKESGLPVEHIKSMDSEGNFTIEEPRYSQDFSKYVGKVIIGKSNGVLAMEECELYSMWEANSYDIYNHQTLIAYNIEGHDFKATLSTNNMRANFRDEVKSNTIKISSMYENYNTIIEALNSGLTGEDIKEKFKLSEFKLNTKEKVKVKK